MGNANVCLKRCFYVFCILFGIIGALMLALALFGHGAYEKSEEIDEMLPGIIVFYVVGAVMILLALIGTYGRKEKKWALILFFIGMALMCLFFLWVSVSVARSRPEITNALNKHYKDAVPLDKADQSTQDEVEAMQTELECCGLNKGYQDWGETVPQSCLCPEQYKNSSKCVDISAEHPPPANQSQTMVFSEPCLPFVATYVDEIVDIFLGLSFGIAFIVLIGMVLSMTLLCQMRRRPSTAPVTFSVNASASKYRELSDATENV
ncbi:hypothetical protein MATL_G00248480 [Megalops atlanticus]|uniref:Tetraspanin n=1 Tax=Megalops atlanticus TaxID=7932 RepID=A0A9D3SWW0_MEGAT|nr:hypothetical protein MATL_G00248480 [Megalops atlanticus]